MRYAQLYAISVATLAAQCTAFYLPGTAPHDYMKGEKVDVLVNALTPMLTSATSSKIQSMLNYEYYEPKLRFCQPEGGPKQQGESLGSILFGDRIFNSPYDIHMLQDNATCQTLCTVSDVTAEEAVFINDRIREDYALNWLVDGLPAAEMQVDNRTKEVFYDVGFNLGRNSLRSERNSVRRFLEEDGVTSPVDPAWLGPALNNHYEMVMKYHSPSPGLYRVVGVLVWPFSIGGSQEESDSCQIKKQQVPLVLSEKKDSQKIRYTYRVSWEESDTKWATRWDHYLHIVDPRIHWFSLINSLVIVSFLCVMVSMILARSVSHDISRYNDVDLNDEIREDFGWKVVHGEVFRAPPYPMLLSVAVGNGSQLCIMFGTTLVFALLGFLSPSNRGAIATVMIVCWSLFGGVGGYVSSRLYTSLGGVDQKKNTFITATLLPTFVFMVMFLLNLFLIMSGSSGAVPFGTILLIVLLWFGISAPLSSAGAYLGTKHGGIYHPVRVNQIPRQIPPAPRYLGPWPVAIIGGILPFGAAFVELYYVLSSLFASRAYYAFGFLGLTAGVVSLTTATVSILFTYFNLCAEEYRWQWRAFLTGGGSAFWLLAYGLFYWAYRLSLHSLSSVALYLGYLFLLVLLDFLVMGSIGFVASYWAVRRLYSAIRID